jgi:hypothetical protein
MIKTRLFETNFLVADVQPGRSGHRHFQMVGEHGYALDELLDEDPSLGFGGGSPGPVDSKVLEDRGNSSKRRLTSSAFASSRRASSDSPCAAAMAKARRASLLGEQVGSDPVVVVQAKQLPPLPLQLVHCVQ